MKKINLLTGEDKINHVLVTGAAGFIGFHFSITLLNRGISVTGIDNLNDYYETTLKEERLKRLAESGNFSFHKIDLEDMNGVEKIFKENNFDAVVHLAAQAGVRYSIDNPHVYISSNVTGFLNILEGCRHSSIGHLVFASSSSVYGANRKLPLSVRQNVDHPISLYAATKKADELMAHTYSALYGIPATGLRFFTVYGPWGRPDMAYFVFTKRILERKPIEVYNMGRMKRDFTYIDDIAEGVYRVLFKKPEADPMWDGANPEPGVSFAPFKIYNIGNSKPVKLLRFIELLENELGMKAEKKFLPLQPGDVIETCADTADLEKDTGFKPETDISEGIKKFVKWYKKYYSVK
jgi:UDP-glucuronate 4-epimerase